MSHLVNLPVTIIEVGKVTMSSGTEEKNKTKILNNYCFDWLAKSKMANQKWT